jgi:CheY-like chemotaxis protein
VKSGSNNKKKILLVDDSKDIRDLVNATIDHRRLFVLQADNGAEGVAIALKEQPDLIVMDIEMPGEMDGIAATRAIKATETGAKIPIINLTGTTNNKKIQDCYEAGAIEHLLKPFSPLELLEKIEKVLK